MGPKRLGDRLAGRVFSTIFPHLAQGFLADRTDRLGLRAQAAEDERAGIFDATLTLLYRLLFLLHAEGRDLLPVRAASLRRIKEDVADRAGPAEADVPARLEKAYSVRDTRL